MNIFVLNTGRCGSTTFSEACNYITNYTVSHESRVGCIGRERFSFPENHIEVDNRLTWFLGRLDKAYGDKAVYVHLKRDVEKTAKSFVKRWDFDGGIIRAYRKGMLEGLPEYIDPYYCCLDYCDTVDSNIELFLKDKSNCIELNLENAKEDFAKFFDLIDAKGDKESAIKCFDKNYNSSDYSTQFLSDKLPVRLVKKTIRVFHKIPYFIANA